MREGPAADLLPHRECVVLSSGSVVTFNRWGDGYSRVVMLIHGLGLSADCWQDALQWKSLEDHRATYIAVDVPQHVPWADDSSVQLPAVAPLFLEMMTELGVESYSVAGHSLGAAVALHLTLLDDRVDRCFAGGVGTDLWEVEPRQELASLLHRGAATRPADTGLLTFLRHQGRDLGRLATLVQGVMPAAEKLGGARGRIALTSTEDDATSTAALSARAGLNDAVMLPGDHVSSFVSGDFVAAALELLAPKPSAAPGSRCVLALSGLPGSGKTNVGVAAAGALGAELLSRDAVRHELFPAPSYSVDESVRVAEEMLQRAHSVLDRGAPLVIDQTGRDDLARRHVRDLCERAGRDGYRVLALWLDGDSAVLRQRVDSRTQSTQRLAEDESDADVEVFDRLVGEARPGWVGIRCDTTLVPREWIAEAVCQFASGTAGLLDVGPFFHAQAVLATTAAEARALRALPKWKWVEQLRHHVRLDSAAGVPSKWGRSTVVDMNVGHPVMAAEVLETLLGDAGLKGAVDDCNAGIAHTYGYLFADSYTPHGFKRDRWLDGRLDVLLGVAKGRLRPLPVRGTLLSNLTAVLDTYVRGVECDWVNRHGTEMTCLYERDPISREATATWLVHRKGVPGAALIYTASADGSNQGTRYVTAFPVDDDYAASLRQEERNHSPLAGRFNAVLSSASNVAAERTWVEPCAGEGGPLQTVLRTHGLSG